jgi:hypothetical protein
MQAAHTTARSAPFSAPRVESGSLPTSATYLCPAHMRQPAPRAACVLALPMEPEDAPITGGTRSLDRRLLALNLAGTRSPTPASRVAPRFPPPRGAYPLVSPRSS